MKKLIALLTTLTIALSIVPVAAGAAGNNVSRQVVTVYLDNQSINFTYQPMIINEFIYVPLYAFCDALPMSYTVNYDNAAQIVTIEAPGVRLGMTVGAFTMVWNYVNRPMRNPMLIVSDVLYIPLGDVANIFGYIIDWRTESNIVLLKSINSYQTIADWNDKYYFVGNVYSDDILPDCEIGTLYNKANGNAEICGKFIDGKFMEGAEFYESGAYSIGNFSNSGLEGYGESYYAYGDIYKGEFKNSIRCGYGTYYFSNGIYDVGNWENGVLNGYAEHHVPDEGSVLYGNYINGRREGKFVEYSSMGTVISNYTNGELNGMELFYDDKGNLRFYIMYDNGKLIYNSLYSIDN